MFSNTMSNVAARHDADLVAASLRGDRDAFGEVVSRYQSLVCSLAYSALGSVAQSEDIAQETFIAAWGQLRQLREPAKLKAWLCGIARNRINRALGRQGREPSHAAESLDSVDEAPTPDPMPSDNAVTQDEEAILWHSLQTIPEQYREPLVLYYREGESVERVAEALDLSEEAVRQRLSRGRKLLQDQVTLLVEGTLRRTAPNQAFTTSVLSALPLVTATASAGSLGAGMLKGGTLAKAAGAASTASTIVAPILGLYSGWLARRVQMDNAESPRERAFVARMFRHIWILAGGFCLAVLGCTWWLVRAPRPHPTLPAIALVTAGVAYVIALLGWMIWSQRTLARIQSEEQGKQQSVGTVAPRKRWLFRSYEYRSRATLLGLPLVHVRMECMRAGKTAPARGWIAIGNYAQGVIAVGGGTVGLVSIGGMAVGPIAIGGIGIGGAVVAGMAIGGAALGGMALGYIALGGTCIGWLAARGGLSIAHDYAQGRIAMAPHANDSIATAFFANHDVFAWADWITGHAIHLVWIPVLIIGWQILSVRRAGRRATAGDFADPGIETTSKD